MTKYIKDNLPLIVIFGRTNVGKSTLFNCLTERRSALVSNIEGTTRDSNLGVIEWQGKKLKLVDTGGIMEIKLLTANKKAQKKLKADKDIDIKVQQQARDYLSRADLILYLVDTKAGLLPQDKELSLILKKLLAKNTSSKSSKNNILLVANKADNPTLRKETHEFNKLGLGEPVPVSATSGSGTGDLLDLVVKFFPKAKIEPPFAKAAEGKKEGSEDKKEIIKVSIIGKPNVGKSSLLNSLIGEDRLIVSPIAHTTREPQDAKIEHGGQTIKLIDTAGISRQGQKLTRHAKIKTLEKFSIAKSLKVIEKSDITLLVVDINKGLTHQESKLVEEIVASRTSLIIIANKWDLVEERNTKKYTRQIYYDLPFAAWAPIQFISALTGEKVSKVLDVIIKVREGRTTEVQPNALSKFLLRIIKKHRPAKAKGTKHPHIYELSQKSTNPPLFTVRIGAKDTIHFSYLRFIKNRLREKFGFFGTPIYLGIEKNKRIHGKHEERIIHSA